MKIGGFEEEEKQDKFWPVSRIMMITYGDNQPSKAILIKTLAYFALISRPVSCITS